MLASIPMPVSAPPPPPPSGANEAWEKAQQALKKISPKKPMKHQQPTPLAPPPNAHALMVQYYPWMAQSYGMQYPPPPTYSTGYQQPQQNFAQLPSTNNQPWNNNQKMWNNQKQWNKRPQQQQKQPQTQAKKFTPFALAPRVATQKTFLQPAQPAVNNLAPGGLGVMPENVKYVAFICF
ncbi:unnamed protein product [Strongylus vulgaris]|uniref:Uncharacterized protein n=1 Tax=Strongylus vulgaris TaxID=40348 RepID=A0A3P7J0T2_STRVU|nr:unnamed protein product [Strongylus vulgaris]